jgi:hypothetical protein
VPLDGARAQEQSGPDLRVGKAVARQSSDLGLLGCQIVPGLDAAPADVLAGRHQLSSRSFGERIGTHRCQHLVGCAQLGTGVDASVFSAQPLSGQQFWHGRCPGEVAAVHVGRRKRAQRHRAEQSRLPDTSLPTQDKRPALPETNRGDNPVQRGALGASPLQARAPERERFPIAIEYAFTRLRAIGRTDRSANVDPASSHGPASLLSDVTAHFAADRGRIV